MENTRKRKRCASMKNTTTMDKCETYISDNKGICGVHKRRKLLYLPDGSVWKNPHNSNLLELCKKYQPSLKFWKMFEECPKKLCTFYSPETPSNLRIEKVSYLKKELSRLNVTSELISEDRYYWFLNLLYYLGNFTHPVTTLQKFYRGPFREKQRKRKKAAKTIWKYYSHYIFKKTLPLLAKNGKELRRNKCINIMDPVTQTSFVHVPNERWVICKYPEMKECWWFDLSSAIQLLGAPGSYSSFNPFNRREYPSEFLFDVEEKLDRLKHKYQDLKNLTISRNQISISCEESAIPPECYSYKRFLIHINSNILFESFKESGYIFPRNVFLKYSIRELRFLAEKILENWNLSSSEERYRIFPNGEVFPESFVQIIRTCSNSTVLKSTILKTLLKATSYQNSHGDRLYGCLKTLIVLGNVNKESHIIIENNGLCDCMQY